jgi:peptide methionine sulfoxide reductase msrA/msrB
MSNRAPVIVIASVLAVVSCAILLLEGAKMGQPLPTTQAASSGAAPMPPLNAEEKRIIEEKGTEAPFTGKYWNTFAKGVYVCRRCGVPLYLSETKFKSDCGWPSFDDEIPGAVKRLPDADGRRTEIQCANCGAHLGHVFVGEKLTARDTRHCVNSASIVLVPEEKWPLQRAIFAGGCFWGVEHLLRQAPGVLAVRSGYTGGKTERPTYEQVCAGKTGHREAVEVLFDPNKVSYERLARLFFEIHDPTQKNGQGPDIGEQYRSAVFYVDDGQKKTAEDLIALLKGRKYDVATEVKPASTFWPAEEYHQDYLTKHPGRSDCHVRVERFGPASQSAPASGPAPASSPAPAKQ